MNTRHSKRLIKCIFYLNPSTDFLNYRSEGLKNIEVYNSLGQKLKEEKADGSLYISFS